MYSTYVLHLGALLKSIVATSPFTNHHHNRNVIHPTVSMITALTHTDTDTHSHTPKLTQAPQMMYAHRWRQAAPHKHTHFHLNIHSYPLTHIHIF